MCPENFDPMFKASHLTDIWNFTRINKISEPLSEVNDILPVSFLVPDLKLEFCSTSTYLLEKESPDK